MMGMGEPLHNLDNVIPAIQIMIDGNGLQLSNRRVTVSTCGLVPEMERLGREIPNVNLAVSLNATTDELRDRIMPVNRRYPLKELLQACREFPLPGRRKVTFEYVMLGGVNDTLEDAKRLLRLISDIPNKVNLIPFNEHEGCDFKAPTRAAIDAFHKYLIDRHVTVITRDSRGGDISAACGQLKGGWRRINRIETLGNRVRDIIPYRESCCLDFFVVISLNNCRRKMAKPFLPTLSMKPSAFYGELAVRSY